MIKAVLFDYGGVVVGRVNDSNNLPGDPSLEKVAHTLGMPYEVVLETVKDIAKLQRGEIDEGEMWERFAQQHDIILLPNYENLLATDVTKIYTQNEDVVDLIHKLKTDGVRVGVLSNTIESHVQAFEQEKRYEIFDTVTLSCRVGARKPEERIYRAALNSFEGINPEECVFIDDVKGYVKAATNIGMKGINFRYGIENVQWLREELKELGLSLL